MAQMNRIEVGRIVTEIDEVTETQFWRDPYRPGDGHAVKRRSRQDPEITRAKTRMRTARYRVGLDRRAAPTTAQIGMALVVALATSRLEALTDGDRGLVGRALVDLQARGFSIDETREMLRRLRKRILGPQGRKQESDDGDAPPAS